MLKFKLLDFVLVSSETKTNFLFSSFISIMELTFTDNNFSEEVLNSDKPVLVDFWAPWCGPCQMMGPIIDELANEMKEKNVKIGKLNVDDNQDTAAEYNVLSIPTFLVFKNGKVVDQLVGGVQKEKLSEVINRHLA